MAASSAQLKNVHTQSPTLAGGSAIYAEYLSCIRQLRTEADLPIDGPTFGTKAAAHITPLAALLLDRDQDNERVERAGLAILLFDHHVGIIDHLTDSGEFSVDLMHEASLVLMSAQQIADDLHVNSSEYLRHARALFLEASRAERTLLNLAASDPSAGEDAKRLGAEKNAILRMAPLLVAGKLSPEVQVVEKQLLDISGIIQVIDDLADWQDDLREGKNNYVLTRAAALAGSFEASAIARELFARGLAQRMMEELVIVARKAFGNTGHTSKSADIILGLISSLEDLATYLKTEKDWSDLKKLSSDLQRLVHPVFAYVK